MRASNFDFDYGSGCSLKRLIPRMEHTLPAHHGTRLDFVVYGSSGSQSHQAGLYACLRSPLMNDQCV